MYPARATLQHVIKAWWKVAWQKAGKTLPVFFFVNEHNNTNTKPQAKKQRFLKLSQKFPEEKQQLVEEKDADNIRKVLCKSFIQCFWELNLCWCTELTVLVRSGYSFELLKWKSRHITNWETSLFCFLSSPYVSLDFVSGSIRTLGKTKLTVSLGIWH